MKQIIALSVLGLLIAGNAFAATQPSGSMEQREQRPGYNEPMNQQQMQEREMREKQMRKAPEQPVSYQHHKHMHHHHHHHQGNQSAPMGRQESTEKAPAR